MDGTIGFIGAGNMAEAMIRGLLGRGVFAPERVVASAPREARAVELRERWGIDVTPDNREVVRRSDVLVLSVKPQMLLRVVDQIADEMRDDRLVISIAAGVPVAAIEARAGRGLRLVRAMPNTPVLVESGATAIAAGPSAAEADLALAKTIFDTVGITAIVDETHLDAVTGLSGSGPAYAFLILEALSDAGVRVGLNRRTSQLLAAQTLLGAARLLLETGTHPAQLREMVTSPGGTAIAGLHVLEANAVRAAMMSAVEAATLRAAELGARFTATSSDLGCRPEAGTTAGAASRTPALPA